MINIGIIGTGNIGKELKKKAIENGWNVAFTMNSKAIYDSKGHVTFIGINEPEYLKWFQSTDLNFLAIPTLDEGKTARKYLETAIRTPMVTCEKGALGNLPLFYNGEKISESVLVSCLKNGRIGYSACVGGGTGMLFYLKSKVTPEFSGEIHAVINGTNNFILHGLSQRRSLEAMTDEAIKSGYAEPGGTSPYEIIKSEAEEDVPMKTAILFNETGLSDKLLRASDIKINSLSNNQLENIVDWAKNLRYVVSITQNKTEDGISVFSHKIDKWYIEAGFRPIDMNPYGNLVVPGVNNCLYIDNGKNGAYTLNGPGAGSSPTAEVMIEDAKRLLKNFLQNN